MPKCSRKANYSLPESRFLVEKFKLHSAYFENNWTNGSRFEKTEVWQDIFDQYCEQFPHTDRTALDIRRKLIKLRSEAKMIMERERLLAQGANIQELLSERTLKLSVSPAHKMMMKAMKGDDDWAADNGDFVEYELEFEDDETIEDDEDDVEYVEEGNEEGRFKEVNPEKIIKKLFQPGAPNKPPTMTNYRPIAPKPPPVVFPSVSSEPPAKKRKHRHKDKDGSFAFRQTSEEILIMQKENLELERKKFTIECDNLYLQQKKLQLEIKLLEQQTGQSLTSSSTGNEASQSAGWHIGSNKEKPKEEAGSEEVGAESNSGESNEDEVDEEDGSGQDCGQNGQDNEQQNGQEDEQENEQENGQEDGPENVRECGQNEDEGKPDEETKMEESEVPSEADN